MKDNKYQPIIGLEVHVELKTKSKMFCGCSADYFGKEPNTHTCPVCLGLPGALPVPNKKAIEWCIMIGLALNCKVSLFSKFDRKNYFYPDLPKGYQISQYDQPFCEKGWIEINKAVIANAASKKQVPLGDEVKQSTPQKIASSLAAPHNDKKRIGITRVHMEEDTAKLTHQFGDQRSKIKDQSNEGYSLIDFNRSGVPLVEIVTEPDFENAQEVKEYLQKLQQIVRYLGVSNADMEKGEMRLEPNISVASSSLRGMNEMNDEAISKRSPRFARDDERVLPSYKVEVKNINSFKFVEKAIDYEIKRHIEILEKGETPAQETRGWDEKKQITVSQRSKEEAKDYRYFPEPDIPPIRLSEFQISNIKSQMGELPDAKFERFKKEYQLSDYDVEILTREKEIADYFEETVKVNNELRTKNLKSLEIKQIANWIIHKKPDLNTILPAQLIKKILSVTQVAAIDEKELEKIVDQVLSENLKAVEDYKKGKENVIMFLVGQVMKKVKQKIDTRLLKEKIEVKIKQ
ncbi:MAG: Asp-tRNA(Asn)/Glu-tRNA(Gln) amidotransferase subunit GatB [Candidatus Levybacteria bacterium]|nr:Asp-tRNA(Asn)/Glu-tRNA(Gln) amidotransferase subunit GatB [Candidatus Levybacteria bacterium]